MKLALFVPIMLTIFNAIALNSYPVSTAYRFTRTICVLPLSLAALSQ